MALKKTPRLKAKKKSSAKKAKTKKLPTKVIKKVKTTKKNKKKTSLNKKISSKKKVTKKAKKITHKNPSSSKVVIPEIIDDLAESQKNQIVPHSEKRLAEFVDNEIKKSPATLPNLSDGLNYYIQAIQRYPLLSREEEIKIAERYQKTKDPKDAEILVTANLRFVVKVAAEYSQFGSKLIDLIQEGNVGLMHAVREFNPYKGARLITYAVWWIKGYIQDYLMKQHSMVKIGTTHNQRKLFYNLEKEKANIDQLGMEPTVKLLSDRLGVPEKDVRMMEQRLARKDLSLDQPLGDEDSPSFLDLEASDESDVTEQLIEHESLVQLTEAIDSIRSELSEKENYILANRLLKDEPMKLQEIGTLWGVSREAVRQMEARLMNKIKNQLIPAKS
jgi:RNA polymerase sigma-32 factor